MEGAGCLSVQSLPGIKTHPRMHTSLRQSPPPLTYRHGPQDEGRVSVDGEGVGNEEEAEDGQLHSDDECQERVHAGLREQYQCGY